MPAPGTQKPTHVLARMPIFENARFVHHIVHEPGHRCAMHTAIPSWNPRNNTTQMPPDGFPFGAWKRVDVTCVKLLLWCLILEFLESVSVLSIYIATREPAHGESMNDVTC